MTKELIFISSVQKELAAERRALRDFIQGNRLLSRHFSVFLFEDLPAKDRRPDDAYIDKVANCDIFLALYAADYGWENPADGISPTEREFDSATSLSKHRLIFLKNPGNKKQHPKMAALIARATKQLTYKRFANESDLPSLVYDSLVEHLEDRGIIQNKPFDAAVCPDASLTDIATDKIKWFLKIARQERKLHLSAKASPQEVLTHLKLLTNGKLLNAAALLFSREPQRHIAAAVTKCAFFNGVEIAKPIPSYQLFEGTLFDQVDNAVDFVMEKLDRTVATRESGASAPVRYEIPKEAIAEIVVNAVAHRDYTSNASVQVFVFSDRVEVSNPGRLPKGFTPEHLTKPHSSEPANPHIAHPLYLAHYIESLGTGTLDVIRLCHESGLPAPEFAQRGNQFVVTIWRDWLTEAAIDKLDISNRQRQGILYIKKTGKITNSGYQELTGVARKTASRDLDGLVEKGILEMIGSKRGAYYVLTGRR